MKESEKISKFFWNNISRKYPIDIIEKSINKVLKYHRPYQVQLALDNFVSSDFWRKYSYKHPDWIFDKDRLKFLRNLTFDLDSDYADEIKEISTLFVKTYNSFILHEFQEEFNMFPFIKPKDFGDDLRSASCFFILNKEKMYNIINDEIENEKLMFIFVGILFYVLETPPKVFQYFKNEEKYWEFFKDRHNEIYSLYDIWKGWSWLDNPVELKITTEEIQKFYDTQRENRVIERKAAEMNSEFYKILKGETK